MRFGLVKRALIARGYWGENTGDDGSGAGANGGSNGDGNGSGNNSGDSNGASGNPIDGAGDSGAKNNKPSDSEAKLLKEVMTRKAREKALEEEISGLKTKLVQFDGINVDEVKALLESQKAKKEKDLEEKGQWDALKQQMREENEKIVSAKDKSINELSQELAKSNELIQKLTIEHEFASSTFITKDTHLSPRKAKVIYGEYFEVEDGKVVPYNKPAGEKDRAPMVDEKGEVLPFKDAIVKIIESDPDKNLILKSKMKPGANSSTSSTSGKAPNQQESLSGIDKIKAALSNTKK